MLKQALYIFILLIASASAPICAFASDDPFVVEGVEVYAESDTLDNAKRDAVNKGTVEAFDTLLK